MELILAYFLFVVVGWLVRYAQDMLKARDKMESKEDYEKGFKDGRNAGQIEICDKFHLPYYPMRDKDDAKYIDKKSE